MVMVKRFFGLCAAALITIFLDISKVVSSDIGLHVEPYGGYDPYQNPSEIYPIGVVNDPIVGSPLNPPISIDDPTVVVEPIPSPTADPIIKDDPISTDKPSISYKAECRDGGLGVKITYDPMPGTANRMIIVVSYDTESSAANIFFAEQFKIEIFQGFNQCNVIEWVLAPCKKSMASMGSNLELKHIILPCPTTNEQSEVDKLHACVATLYNTDMPKVAAFVICYFTQGKQAKECACKNNLNYEDIEKCARAEEGANYCDAFYHSIHENDFSTQVVRPKLTPELDAIGDFKNTACAKLNEAKLKCGFCPPCE